MDEMAIHGELRRTEGNENRRFATKIVWPSAVGRRRFLAPQQPARYFTLASLGRKDSYRFRASQHISFSTKMSSKREIALQMHRHASLSAEEVARRKKRIAAIVKEVRKLLRGQVPGYWRVPSLKGEPLSRSNVLKAFDLVGEAKNLIDPELKWLDIRRNNTQFGNDYYDPSDDEGSPHPPTIETLFAEEIALFSPSIFGTGDESGSLFLLPRCFYTPLDEAMTGAKLPGKKALDEMRHKAGWIWGAEDHMQTCHFTEGEAIDEHDAKGYVFWKYSLKDAQFFSECLSKVPWEVVTSDDPIEYLDALRIETRRKALERPNEPDQKETPKRVIAAPPNTVPSPSAGIAARCRSRRGN